MKETKVGMRSYTRQPSQPVRPLQQKSHFVQWHMGEVRVPEILNIENP